MIYLEFGFKDYDELVFGNNQTDISPFTPTMWASIMSWYWKIAGIIGGPILVAIVILAWKMIIAGVSPDKRSEVKDSLMRLIFGAVAIVLAPFFVRFVLLLNNSMVDLLVANTHGSLDDLLGNSVLTNIRTGNAIATAIVIAMFAYLFVKINVKFIIRQFTLIIFTIFTPIVAVFWIINKRTVASSIWFGQILINAFMQFVYTFLFLIYMNFLPKSDGWATALLWAMMVLPLADALQNMMQNLVSRIAGINNEELSNRGIGMGMAIGYTVKSIAYQFKQENQEKVSQARKAAVGIAMPQATGLGTNSANASESSSGVNSTNYESHSKNIMEDKKTVNAMENNKQSNKNVDIFNAEKMVEDNLTGGIKKAYNAGKGFMSLGMHMAEGRNIGTNNKVQPTDKKKFNTDKHIEDSRKDIENSTNKIITVEENDEDDKE